MRGQRVICEGSWGIQRSVKQSSFVIDNIRTWGQSIGVSGVGVSNSEASKDDFIMK